MGPAPAACRPRKALGMAWFRLATLRIMQKHGGRRGLAASLAAALLWFFLNCLSQKGV